MAGSVNKVMLIGHLGAKPDVRSTASGGKVAAFSVATSETWRDKATGERHERTEWHRVVIFNEPLVEIAEKFLRKGSKVFVEGMQATRKWTDKAGIERFVTETVLKPYRGTLELLDKADRAPAPGADDYGTTSARPAAGEAGAADPPPLDDDIPF